MPIIQPDMSQTADQTPIDPGTYPAKVITALPGTSKAGNAKVTCEVDVMVEGKERKRKIDVPTAGKGAFMWEQFLRACGFKEIANRLRNKENVPFNTDDLVGQSIQVVIENEMYNDNLQDKITRYIAA